MVIFKYNKQLTEKRGKFAKNNPNLRRAQEVIKSQKSQQAGHLSSTVLNLKGPSKTVSYHNTTTIRNISAVLRAFLSWSPKGRHNGPRGRLHKAGCATSEEPGFRGSALSVESSR